MAELNESIFREYDIRGIVENDLQDDQVEQIASAFAAIYVREGKKQISLGMDGRPSSENIKRIFTETLCGYGIDVIDIGLVPTPVLYYSVFKLKLGGGIIIQGKLLNVKTFRALTMTTGPSTRPSSPPTIQKLIPRPKLRPDSVPAMTGATA